MENIGVLKPTCPSNKVAYLSHLPSTRNPFWQCFANEPILDPLHGTHQECQLDEKKGSSRNDNELEGRNSKAIQQLDGKRQACSPP